MKNPFDILGATPRDSRKKLMQLEANAALLGSEADAQAARIALTTPHTRLAAELRYLPRPQGEALGLLASMYRENLPALSSAPRSHAVQLLHALCRAFGAVNADQALALVNDDHEAAGFLPVTPDEMLEALDAYADEIASRAYEATRAQTLEWHISVMDQLIKTCLDGELALLEKLAAGYEMRTLNEMDRLQGKVTDYLKQLRECKTTIRNYIHLRDSAVRAVQEWNRLARPLRDLYARQGRKYHKTFAFFDEVHDVVIELINNRNCFSDALQFHRAMCASFADVPEVAGILNSDAAVFQKWASANDYDLDATPLQRTLKGLLRVFVKMILPVLLCALFARMMNSCSTPTQTHNVTVLSGYGLNGYEVDNLIRQTQQLIDLLDMQVYTTGKHYEKLKKDRQELWERCESEGDPLDWALLHAVDEKLEEARRLYETTLAVREKEKANLLRYQRMK